MTILDSLINRGSNSARRKARKKNPDFAARDDIRRVHPGIVLGSTGPGGLKGLFDDQDLIRNYHPWWYKSALRISRARHKPKAWKRSIVSAWQRSQRGWSDIDAYNLSFYLSKVIRDSTKFMRENSRSWPGDPMTIEEWNQILTEISDGMQAYLDFDELILEGKGSGDSDQETLAKVKFNLAMDHLKKYWADLWD